MREGIWFIVTLVTHSSGWAARGWAELFTTSASIRWIRPDYMYPDESSQGLVYCLRSQNMFGWYMKCLDCVLTCNYLMNYFTLAYPICCLVVLCVALLSCDDHQFNWWEQMGEVLAVNMGTVTPLLSHLGWIFYFELSFRATAYVFGGPL